MLLLSHPCQAESSIPQPSARVYQESAIEHVLSDFVTEGLLGLFGLRKVAATISGNVIVQPALSYVTAQQAVMGVPLLPDASLISDGTAYAHCTGHLGRRRDSK
jgi:hypothetical protein